VSKQTSGLSKLTIEFGGLCLFVQGKQGKNTRLCVLMPSDTMHGHKPQVSPESTAWKDLPPQKSYDLTSYLDGGSQPVVIPKSLRWTKHAGAHVKKDLLDSTKFDHGLLAARLYLPYPKSAHTPYKGAKVKVVKGDGTETTPFNVVGTVSLDYELKQPFSVGPLSVTASDMTVRIGNFIPGSKDKRHEKDEKLKHALHYLPLLSGLQETLPYAITTEVYEPDISFIDPVECTVGTGCPEDEINCGWG
jgi:hypothetical protein